MTYEAVAHFAKSWGIFLLIIPFTIAVAYALWPSNQDEFGRAARAPLNQGDE